MPQRRFLMLQGVSSPFFCKLANRLEAAGCFVLKLNFCSGDWVYSLGIKNSINHRWGVKDLKTMIPEIWEKYQITDQILFGDRRPVHKQALISAERYGIRTHVFEEGYFRPHWVTLEQNGVNGRSLLPRSPEWFIRAAKVVTEDREVASFQSSLYPRALHDVIYQHSGIVNPLLFPGYRRHSPVSVPVEYAGFLVRRLKAGWRRASEDETIAALIQSGRPYYVFPLQLSTDAQILSYSDFDDVEQALSYTLRSFIQCADKDAVIVVKNHPFDYHLDAYETFIRMFCNDYEVSEGRIVFLEGGNLESIVAHSRGVVTVNSTVGGVALKLGRPTVALADPIYNLPGLTFQGGLDQFWEGGEAPDPELFRDFYKVVIHATQLNGGFYSSEGIALALENAAQVLLAPQTPLESLIDEIGH